VEPAQTKKTLGNLDGTAKSDFSLLRCWNWIREEGNNRGVTLIILFVGFCFSIFGIFGIGNKINTIKVDLENIKAKQVETNQIAVPNGNPLNFTDSKTGLPLSQFGVNPGQEGPIVQIGSAAYPSKNGACLQFTLPESTSYVHIHPKAAGTTVVWEAGECPSY
jgi:hypothetical protein